MTISAAQSHEAGAEYIRWLLNVSIGPTPGGYYLHWDELRHKKPPEGLSHEGLVVRRQGRLPLAL